jgi:dihydroorotate dehydrogenase
MTIPPAIYDGILRPLLFRLDPESAHRFAMAWLKLLAKFPGIARLLAGEADPRDACEVFGIRFPNRIGLAAGFDKEAAALLAWEALGFGHVEAGTITALAQPGNEKPRVFRVPSHRALINRMGFNNGGADAVAARLDAVKRAGRWPRIPVGINLGKSKVVPVEKAAGDYLRSLAALHRFADYLVLNVSSPNTPGLRKLQDPRALDELVAAVLDSNRELSSAAGRAHPTPLLVKIAPDLDGPAIEGILELAERRGVSGLISTNTTLDHSAIPENMNTEGGLSGAPLRGRATEILRFIAGRTRLPIIASGGVMDADAAKEKIDSGAALVQVYTGFVYRGPALLREIAVALRA